ncbi:von Willebrand factor type A domain-containing protein [Fibrobacterota bacterium]
MKTLITLSFIFILLPGCFKKSSQVEEQAAGKQNMTELTAVPETKKEQTAQVPAPEQRTEKKATPAPQPEEREHMAEVRAVEGIPAEPLMVGPASAPAKVRGRSGKARAPMMAKRSAMGAPAPRFGGMGYADNSYPVVRHNTEQYDRIYENAFRETLRNPLSTFSIDVDAASYANVRRFLNAGRMPPQDAVRIEEFINYFSYDYPQPKSADPFSITAEVSECPWESRHKLVHIGLQGKRMDKKDLPPSNLVFLLDVSGSMNSPGKLPLLKKAMKLLVDQLRPEDMVSIAVYAGAAGTVLPPTSGDKKMIILETLEKLRAGGSTAGGAGITLAYKMAWDTFMKNGNNRVILATDGDFNLGVSSDGELVRMIEQKRKTGVYLTVLGFGRGNYKDSKMEKLAGRGNGNYAYIDNIMEAKKVLINEIGGTLMTIAKDVKIQVEFNPDRVKAYRLIGYENRMLKAEDFNNDKKDAGELGAGHTVTALYQVVPAGVEIELPGIDALKYQNPNALNNIHSSELLTVKFRYKSPQDTVSKLIVKPLKDRVVKLSDMSADFRFSAAVAGFGMLLRGSKQKGTISYSGIIDMAKKARGKDDEGYRAEFIRLVQLARLLDEKTGYIPVNAEIMPN